MARDAGRLPDGPRALAHGRRDESHREPAARRERRLRAPLADGDRPGIGRRPSDDLGCGSQIPRLVGFRERASDRLLRRTRVLARRTPRVGLGRSRWGDPRVPDHRPQPDRDATHQARRQPRQPAPVAGGDRGERRWEQAVRRGEPRRHTPRRRPNLARGPGHHRGRPPAVRRGAQSGRHPRLRFQLGWADGERDQPGDPPGRADRDGGYASVRDRSAAPRGTRSTSRTAIPTA